MTRKCNVVVLYDCIEESLPLICFQTYPIVFLIDRHREHCGTVLY